MQSNEEYFMVAGTDNIKGELQSFISKQEAGWRPIQKLQKQPLKIISRYIRSIQYTPLNTRTVSTLKNSLNYLVENIFPIFLKSNISQQQKIQIAIFLHGRLKSIRCEYFVQGIIHPTEALKIVRCNILIELLKGDDDMWQQFAGLDDLLCQQHRQIMTQRFPHQYEEALKYSIFILHKKEIQSALWSNPYILQDQQLLRLLRLRLQIENGNFEAYYTALQKEDIIIKCLLWRYFPDIKTKMVSIVKKAYGDVRLDWVLGRLGCQLMNTDSWICLKKDELPKCNYIGHALWIDCSQLLPLLQ